MAGTVMDLLLQAHKRQQDAPPPKKRHRIAPNHVASASPSIPREKKRVIAFGKRTARLSRLPELPVDILFEIFGHLMPLDLLHLARTNKDLRQLLMRKSASSTWKEAFSNVTDIGCPDDVSYPAWASLIWDKDCHNCRTPNSRTMNFFLRIRLCARCSRSCLSEIGVGEETRGVKSIIQECIPYSNWGNGYAASKVCVVRVKREFQKGLERAGEDGEEAKSEFIRQKKEVLRKQNDHAALWESWSNSLQNDRQRELDDIRDKRSRALERKLIAEGYEAEVQRLNDSSAVYYDKPFPRWADHPAVKQPKPLTDRHWNQIKSDMIKYMEDVKADRLREERRRLIWKRRELATEFLISYRSTHHPPGNFFPSPIDFWFWRPIKELIDSPSTETVKFDFHDINIAPFVNRWIEEKMSELCRLLRFSDEFWYARPADLKRATCVFSCTHHQFHRFPNNLWPEGHYPCMWFPEFIHHPCNALEWKSHDPGDVEYLEISAEDDQYTRIDKDVRAGASLEIGAEFPGRYWRRRQWSTKWLTYDEKASRTVRNILDACGMDRKATVESVDEADPRVVCLKCSFGAKPDGVRRYPILTWRGAVQHSMKRHWGDSGVSWHMLSSEEAARARVLEQQEYARRGIEKPPERSWRCGQCKDTSQDPGYMSLVILNQHFDEKHDGSKNIEADVDYYRGMDMPPRQPLVVQMIPPKYEEEECSIE
uniref:F-box domain-containing protein n=1 Tax=Moniliophthora roreri TaxID=221103 RepID=A0A0W0FTM3_MONRR